MKTYKINKAYKTQYKNPIILNKGEVVTLGEPEKEEKWKGWIWATTHNNQGWVPVQILEISEDQKSGTVLQYYSAQELNVDEGDLIEKIRSLNGWTWARELKSRNEGWIPDEVIAF